MEFTYTSKGTVWIKPIVSEEKDRFLAVASLAELSKYIPNIDTKVNVDLLAIAFDAFVANRVNKNDDVSDSATSVAIAKTFVNKPINIEHDRSKVMGVITNYAFTKFGSDEALTEDEALATKDPFNVTLGGVLWRVVNKNLAKMVEASSDPTSEFYQEVSASWEVGFMDYVIAAVSGDSRNLADAKIIEDNEEIKKLSGYMKAFGGKGHKGDNKLYRLVKGAALGLGVGLTGTPAADVKGIATLKSQEPEVEVSTETDASQKVNNSTENISQTKENVVIQERQDNMSIKITKLEDITDEGLKQMKASEVTEFIKVQMKTAEETFLAEKTKLENQIKASNEASTKLLADQAKLQEDMKKVSETLASLQAEKEARAKQDTFNSRMASLDGEFNLVDAEREVIAANIVNLDETAYASYKKQLDVLLAAKKKAAKKNDDDADDKKGGKSAAEQKSTPDNENMKTGPDKDQDTGNSKKEMKTAKASVDTAEQKTQKTEVVATAVDNSQKSKTVVPATATAAEPSLLEKYKSAFGVDMWTSDVKLTD